ncbi:MAG: tRNA epoxyqueuosine(34) reductase QueG [Rhodobacteraceae bacterium]|nr:tRNA epoxyqueuosine(34) reductase QueG [Paracoccaceae bacterium]
MNELATCLRKRAGEEGFDAVGICRADSIAHARPNLREYLKRRYHGQMEWMSRRSHWREDPLALWPEARSVIMLAHSYSPQDNPLKNLDHKRRGTISVYARNRDYHDVVKPKLKRLGRWLIEQRPGSLIKVFVDTAPVMEKPLAQAAGLGWQGKHTNLVSRELGSWFFLGAIFTTVELPPDEPGQDHCGSCRRCLNICPTDAFPAPYQLDARRCISYLTIEHRGPVAPEFRKALGNRIFGCDDCLAVCPWNKFASASRECRYQAREELRAPKLADLVRLDDAAFRKVFRGGPVKRIGRNRFVRNVLYAIGNSGDAELMPDVERLLSDPDPAVAEAAAWARAQLAAAPCEHSA